MMSEMNDERRERLSEALDYNPPDEKKLFDKAQIIGMSGTMENGLRYRMEIVAPLSDEEERQWLLEMADLFKRMIARAPLSIQFSVKRVTPEDAGKGTQ